MRTQHTVEINSVETALRELAPLVEGVQRALEAFVDAGTESNDQELVDVARRLAEIRGTLELLDVHGGALLCAEMRATTDALAGGTVADRDVALERLLKATLRLADYLDRVRAGRRDSPPVLLPLINELRTARAAPPLTERDVFFPDLNRSAGVTFAVTGDPIDIVAAAERLRPRFRRALLNWYRGHEVAAQLGKLGQYLRELADASSSPSGQRLWGACGALTEALAEQGLEADNDVQKMMARVERLLSKVSRDGERALAQQLPVDLLRGLLYHVARSGSSGERVQAIREAYDLPAAMGGDDDGAGFEGPDRNLLLIVSEGIREDIAAVKDAIEIHVHSDHQRGDALDGIPQQLTRIADTFSMLGLQSAHDTIQREAEVVTDLRGSTSTDSTSQLQALADTLLRLEGDLDRLLDAPEAARDSAAPVNAGAPLAGLQSLPVTEYRALLSAIVGAALEDLAKVREALAMYCGSSEAGTEAVAEVPALLDEVHGALWMLPLVNAERVLRELRAYIQRDLVEQGLRPDDDIQILIADVVAGLEYYLEAVDHDRAGMVHLLQGAERAIEALRSGGEPTSHADDEDVVMESTADSDSAAFDTEIDAPEDVAPDDGAEPAVPDARAPALAPDVSDISSADTDTTDNADPNWDWPEGDAEDVIMASDADEASTLSAGELDDPEVSDFLQRELGEPDASLIPPASDAAGAEFEVSGTDPDVADRGVADRGGADPGIDPGDDSGAYNAVVRDEDVHDFDLDQLEDVTADREPAVATTTVGGHDREPVHESEPEPEPEPERSSTADAAGADPAASGSQLAILGDSVDDEIVEVYIEEALGELDRINEQLPQWRANPADEEPLIIVRRAFHTLKGGGRLIGAELIGEFSWAMESMLNRVLERSIDISDAVFDILDEGAAALPQLIEQIQGNRAPIDDIDNLIARAHALSRGESDPPPGGGGPGSRRGPGDGPAHGSGDGPDDPGSPGHGDAGGSGNTAAEPESAGDEPGATAKRDQAFAAGAAAGAGAVDEPLPSDAVAADEIARPVDAGVPAATGTEAELDAGSSTGHGDDVGGDSGREADSELLDIFADEAAQHLAVVRDCLPAAPEQADNHAVDASMQRALHTLHGSAQTAEIESVVALVGPMERILTAHDEQGTALRADELVLFRDTLQAMEAIVAQLPAIAEAEEYRELRDRLESWRHHLDQQDAGGEDNELLDIFIEEGDELVEACERAVQRWRDDPDVIDRVMTDLQRNLHTLKGGARMANLPPLADLTHEIESLVDAINDGELQPDSGVFELLQEAVDALTVLLEQARNHQGVSRVDWLIDELRNRRLRDQTGGADTMDADGGADGAAAAAASTSDAAGEAGSTRGDAPRGDPAGGDPAGGTEQIRVQSDLLDNLVNFAGEVSIYHSRLGEHMGQYKFNLAEFEQTVSRLRAQLRDMENETESQILYRHEKEQDSGPARDDFDPLEFDRYTRIQELSRSLAESVGDLDSIKDILDNLTRDAETLLLQQSRVSSDLQGGLMQTRMVRFDGLRARFSRTVRQTARAVGKQVEMIMSGGEIEVDRSIQERILAPLEHILRNAVSHGIEAPDARRRKGKPEAGSIRLDLHRGGTDIIMEITDDGAGIDPEVVRRKAIEKGMIAADDARDDQQLIELILETGFSTADQVTQIAGRGVGMDVVDAEIRRLGGTLAIQTEKGVGTRFSVRLPVTLAINQAVLVGAGDETYAVPIASIEGVSQITAGDLRDHYVDPSRKVRYAENHYNLHHLGRLLGVSEPRLDHPDVSYPVVMIRAGDERIALHVDQLIGRREVVVKPLGAPLNTLPGISGATIMADGEVVLILDIGGLLRTEGRVIETGGLSETTAESALPESAEEGKDAAVPTILIVDDSITIRKVTQRVLDRNGLRVATAKDGVDAVSWMTHSVPDLILLDIEMPRMDGYEVATYVRGEARLADVPIIMITSRTGDKHRQRAEDIGVNRYLGKPYQESELMDAIRELIRIPVAA